MDATKIILWSARVLGSVIVAFVLFFLFAHILGNGEEAGPMSDSDRLSFAFFPLGLTLGLLVAYKWEGLGGIIATGGMAALFIHRPDLLRSVNMLLIALPGLLYVLYWWMKKRKLV